MENKLKAFFTKIGKNRVIASIVRVFKMLWTILSHNLGLKVLSLIMAVLLWNYVVSSNTSITRTKTLSGLTGYISGQTSLSTYGLAMLENPTEKLSNISRTGYGIYAKYSFFRLEDGEIVPVAHPDYQRLDELFGYERERDIIIRNTTSFAKGQGASNMLLYGDAGTGKSSTIKAVCASLAPKGLRIIEVKKNQLYQIPALMDELAKNPLKFILFIDDLSFASNDDNFAALKAILEGGVGGRSHNVAVYATSNRRHLVKETMADRSGDDLHAMDTRQELMSLSARFGLTVTFQQPDKDRYDRILLELAKQYNVQMPSDQLFIKGAAFALRAGGRSPRVAKQFVELLAAGVKV